MFFPATQIHPVPRRSQELMGLTYAKHFAESPFAYHGAPSGTTSRLRSWCWKPQIGWVFSVFWGSQDAKMIFNGKNLITKNINMTNMTVYDTFSPVLLDFVGVSYDFRSFLVYFHCCKFESSLSVQSGQTLCRCINACEAPPAAVSWRGWYCWSEKAELGMVPFPMCFQWISPTGKKGELFWSSRNPGKITEKFVPEVWHLGAIDFEFLGKLPLSLACSNSCKKWIIYAKSRLSWVTSVIFGGKQKHLQAFLGSTSLVSFFLKRIRQTSSI